MLIPMLPMIPMTTPSGIPQDGSSLHVSPNEGGMVTFWAMVMFWAIRPLRRRRAVLHVVRGTALPAKVAGTARVKAGDLSGETRGQHGKTVRILRNVCALRALCHLSIVANSAPERIVLRASAALNEIETP